MRDKYLKQLVHKNIAVYLVSGICLRGELLDFDEHGNLIIEDATCKTLLINYNNVSSITND